MKIIVNKTNSIVFLLTVIIAACGVSRESEHVDIRPSTHSCKKLKGLEIDGGIINDSVVVEKNTDITFGGEGIITKLFGIGGVNISDGPEFCRVQATLRPVAGSEINFEVWMPTEKWNKRFLGTGNGGFAGSINYKDLVSGVRGGYAVMSTDTGHTGGAFDASWARGQPEKIIDYGWRGVHLSTVSAKKIVSILYGNAPEYSYFSSCSNGGRQALMEASKFPEDYDGILAGAPASRWSSLLASMIHTTNARKIAGSSVNRSQLKKWDKKILEMCDAKDYIADGIVGDPTSCKIDIESLNCNSNRSKNCLNETFVEYLKAVYSDVMLDGGNIVAPAFMPSGAEAGNPISIMGWEGWMFGRYGLRPFRETYATEFLENILNGVVPSIDKIVLDEHFKIIVDSVSENLDATPDMTEFFERGGKLLMWHGWSDPAIPAQLSIDFYHEIVARAGDYKDSSIGLFLMPGMQHCAGGTGISQFGQEGVPEINENSTRRDNIFVALRSWVEDGDTPDYINGRRASLMSTIFGDAWLPKGVHKVCRYPMVAKGVGGANGEVKANCE